MITPDKRSRVRFFRNLSSITTGRVFAIVCARVAMITPSKPARVRFFRNLSSITAGLVIAIVGGAIFSLPPQFHELYRAAAEALSYPSPTLDAYLTPAIAILTIVLLSLALLAAMTSSRIMTSRPARWMTAFVSALPILALALGTFLARPEARSIPEMQSGIAEGYTNYLLQSRGYQSRETAARLAADVAEVVPKHDALLGTFSVALCLIAGLFLASSRKLRGWLGDLQERLYQARPASHEDLVTRPTTWSFKRHPLVALLGITVVVVLFLALAPVSLPRLITPLGITALFLTLLTLWSVALRSLSVAVAWPVTWSLIAFAILLSALDLNDNHWIETDPGAAAPPPMTSSSAFEAWLRSRGGLTSLPEGRKFPVYIVAAQGGGAYAAYHSATLLSSIQDECPDFAKHLFAISAVSGGSVGASVFAGLLEGHPIPPASSSIGDCGTRVRPPKGRSLEDLTAEVLDRDFFAPLQAGMLFPDFMQRFIWPPIGAFDRARTLDKALASSWHDAMQIPGARWLNPKPDNENLLGSQFTAHWKPSTDSLVPALLFNTTETHSGRRRLIAPFTFPGTDLRFMPVWNMAADAPVKPVTLSVKTAAFVSARFPWVTPSAWFEDIATTKSGGRVAEKIRVVDGGYFENSGVATALDLINAMQQDLRSNEFAPYRDKIELVLVVLTSADFSVRSYYGLGESLEPIRAMLSTREARAPIEIARANQILNTASQATQLPQHSGPALLKFKLDGLGYPLPLGWVLSNITRDLIDMQTGFAAACENRAALAEPIPIERSLNCRRLMLKKQLTDWKRP